MGLVRTLEELEKRRQHYAQGSMVGNTNFLFASFLTDPEVVKRVLPPPLEPGPLPTGLVYIAEFGKANFSAPYNEAAVLITAQYEGEIGSYCISMPVTLDTPMWLGRENQGYPKKIADSITIEKQGNTLTGTCIRRGKQIITLTVQLEGPLKQDIPTTASYNVKAITRATGDGFEFPPRLIRIQNDFRWNAPTIGTASLSFGESPFDPIHELPIKDIILAGYDQDIEIWTQQAEVVTELDPIAYTPYYWNKQDWELPEVDD
jgi:acetoacetate decarboxylase